MDDMMTKEESEQWLKDTLEHLESDDCKGEYWDCLLCDNHAVADRISELLNKWKMFGDENRKQSDYDINTDTIFSIIEYLQYNMDDYISDYRCYWGGDESIDAVSFGEMEFELPSNFYRGTDIDDNGFYISDVYCYYDKSESGLNISINEQQFFHILQEINND